MVVVACICYFSSIQFLLNHCPPQLIEYRTSFCVFPRSGQNIYYSDCYLMYIYIFTGDRILHVTVKHARALTCSNGIESEFSSGKFRRFEKFMPRNHRHISRFPKQRNKSIVACVINREKSFKFRVLTRHGCPLVLPTPVRSSNIPD